MESWGVSSEKDDAVKYEHDEITCKIELSVCWDIIPAISAVLWLTLSLSAAWLSSMIMPAIPLKKKRDD